jgi:hypothetical protein
MREANTFYYNLSLFVVFLLNLYKFNPDKNCFQTGRHLALTVFPDVLSGFTVLLMVVIFRMAEIGIRDAVYDGVFIPSGDHGRNRR